MCIAINKPENWASSRTIPVPDRRQADLPPVSSLLFFRQRDSEHAVFYARLDFVSIDFAR
jgi:hypothetical protein